MHRFKGILTGLIVFGMLWVFTTLMSSIVTSSTIEIETLPGRVDAASISTEEHQMINTSNDRQINGVEISSIPRALANRKYTWMRVSNSQELAGMFNLIENELDEYVASYLGKIGLHKILIVDNIQTKDGRPVLGFSDPLAGEIYLNSLATSGAQSRAIVGEQTIHHEIGHFLAYREYGYWFDKQSGWQELGGGELYGKNADVNSEYFPKDGFVSRYGMVSPSEDFAETYSLIYTEYFQEQLRDESQKSELLGKKIRTIYGAISSIDPAQCHQSFQVFSLACD